MATVFGDTPGDVSRNTALLEDNPTRRAIAAMQLIASNNQTGATRYGSDRQLEAARMAATNEAVRLQNAMTLGREELGSLEKREGMRGTSMESLEGMRNTSLENIEKMRGANQLAVAKWNAMLQDPRYAADADQLDAEIEQLNSLAKVAAAQANFALKSGIDGSTKWGGLAKKTLTPAEINNLASKIWTEATSEGATQMYFDGKKFEPIVMPKPPRRGSGLGPTGGLPAVPPLRPNQSLMAPPSYATPPMSYGDVPQLPMPVETAQPTGAVAVPITPPVAAAVPTNAVPQALPTNPYLMNMARGLDWAGPLTAPARGMIDAVTYLPRAALANPTVANALQKLQELGSAALGGTVGRIGTRPAVPNGATGSVAVPTAPTNAVPLAPVAVPKLRVLSSVDDDLMVEIRSIPDGELFHVVNSGGFPILYRKKGVTFERAE